MFVVLAFGPAVATAEGWEDRRSSFSKESTGGKYLLPLVERGIAAGYPGDKGIENNPAVVFHETFEEGLINDLGERWTSISNKDHRVLALVSDAPPGSPGKRCLQMTATKGHDTGGHLWKLLDTGYDRLYARFYVKFAPDAPYVHHFVHMGGRFNSPPWPMGGAGSRPDGTISFSTSMDLVGRDVVDPPGAWSFYSYWCEMHSWQTPEGESDGRSNGFYGNLFGPVEPLQAKRGEWQCVEIMIKLNDPEQSNGEQAFWIDGKLVERYGPETIEGTWFKDMFRRSGVFNTDPKPFEGFRWRTDDRVKINTFWLQYYLAHVFENDYNPHDPEIPYNDNIARVHFDNVVLATEYIGPIVSELPDSGQTGCDFNGDGQATVADVIKLILMQRQDPADLRTDYNGDESCTITDAIALLLDIMAGKCSIPGGAELSTAGSGAPRENPLLRGAPAVGARRAVPVRGVSFLRSQ